MVYEVELEGIITSTASVTVHDSTTMRIERTLTFIIKRKRNLYHREYIVLCPVKLNKINDKRTVVQFKFRRNKK